ncbi:MAG TPA: Csp1 family four helix bundle copper storage protein [Gallionellaceae bacterium]
MNRRELILGAAALAAAATTSRAFAAGSEHEHDHHQHASGSRYDALIAAAADCSLKANQCQQHCIVSMGQGETDLAACARSSSQAAAICMALQQLAVSNAKQLPQLARVAMDICKECEDECRKTERHPECKACKEACIACYNECKRIAA